MPTKYTNVSLTDQERDDLLAIGNKVLAPYGVSVTLPAVIRYMIVQQNAIIRKNEETTKQALDQLKKDSL
jgi:hypothetical protein